MKVASLRDAAREAGLAREAEMHRTPLAPYLAYHASPSRWLRGILHKFTVAASSCC